MSEHPPTEPIIPDQLEPYCEAVAFGAGDVLRVKGRHYKNLYLIAKGTVSVRFDDSADANGAIELGSGAAIGEIGFLHGSRASAHVVATEAASALIIDDATIQRIKAEDPGLAVRLLRFLASTGERRTEQNNAVFDDTQAFGKGDDIEVLLCRNEAMLERALRLRYDVYCGELGRQSPYADHTKKTITDALDGFAHTFIVVADGETIGTLRANLAREGELGIFEELYGMRSSADHPGKTCICTKFITQKSHRGGAVAMKMLATVTGHMLHHEMMECYIDCIPTLLPFYRALGFKDAADAFHHDENGPSHPMRLDAPDARKLSGELGPMQTMRIYLKAQKHRLTEGARRSRKRP